jgi:hypothetical protein
MVKNPLKKSRLGATIIRIASANLACHTTALATDPSDGRSDVIELRPVQ